MKKKFKFKLFFIVMMAISIILAGCAQSNSDAPKEEEKKDNVAVENNTLEELSMQGPVGISISSPFYKIVKDNSLKDVVANATYTPWKNPDELRARISSGQMQVSAVPTYVGANLYNKGMDVKLINVLVWGNLYIVGPEGEKIEWSNLKGQTIHVPFKGDMPDLMLQYLLKKNNLDPKNDVNLQYVSSPTEAVGLMAAGKAKYAILPEHVASLSIIKAKEAGHAYTKLMSIHDEWAKITGKEPRIPQAGILVSGDLIKNHPEVVEELQNQFKQSVEWINQDPKVASPLLEEFAGGMKAPFIEKVIPSLNLSFATAEEAKAELEFFFQELSSVSIDIIGGKLPDDGFYYQK